MPSPLFPSAFTLRPAFYTIFFIFYSFLEPFHILHFNIFIMSGKFVFFYISHSLASVPHSCVCVFFLFCFFFLFMSSSLLFSSYFLCVILNAVVLMHFLFNFASRLHLLFAFVLPMLLVGFPFAFLLFKIFFFSCKLYKNHTHVRVLKSFFLFYVRIFHPWYMYTRNLIWHFLRVWVFLPSCQTTTNAKCLIVKYGFFSCWTICTLCTGRRGKKN